MSDTLRSLSTSGLAPKKQLQTWSDALTDLCGQFDVDPLEGSSFEGRINYTTVSQLKLCQIEASQHRIAHTVSGTKLSEHPYVKILFQTYGISHFEQGGRRIDIMPGDCLAYDVSCPHTIVSPSLTRHEVVIVPKELLHERGFRTSKMLPCKLSARNGTGRIAYDFVHTAFDEANRLSPYNAIGVADSLIDLLLLPLREADTMFDRVGPEAMYIRAQAFIREHLRDPELCIDQISAAFGLHQALSAHAVQRQGHDRQRLYLAREAAALPPGAGDPERKDDHGCRIFVGLFQFVALQPRVPEAFRVRSLRHSQGALCRSHAGRFVKAVVGWVEPFAKPINPDRRSMMG